MDWVRLWHDLPTDPKWRVIAKRCGQPLAVVVAVYVYMLTNASKSPERGTLHGWDDEDVAMALDLDLSDVQSIRKTMQGKVLDGDRLTGWEKRQPKREDETAASRQQAKRERDKAAVTPRHAESRKVTTDKSRLEEIREEKKERASHGADAPDLTPPAFLDRRTKPNGHRSPELFETCFGWLAERMPDEKPADLKSFIGKLRKQHGEPAVLAAFQRAQAIGASNPKEFLVGCLREPKRNDLMKAFDTLEGELQ